MQLTKLSQKQTCGFCGRELEAVHIDFEDRTAAWLCWADLKRLVRMKNNSQLCKDSDRHGSPKSER